ncbi:MAG: T9SS type A sorting domain-containing protein [Urechidicola sp.]|nr:T9SS type A sorting domain-containing protein [Urechidicola sp.]
MKKLLLLFTLTFLSFNSFSQHSVARQWNDLLLESIRKDFARPTIHARNLFHISVAMYDAWAIYEDEAQPFFIGNTLGNYSCNFDGISSPTNIEEAQNEAISYATVRLLNHRFQNSPNAAYLRQLCSELMSELNYDESITSIDYSTGSPAALGNYIAEQLIQFGLQDGANEQNDYGNISYEPINPSLIIDAPGNPTIVDPNRWQPLTLEVYIDQSGNPIPLNTPDFLSPEWGQVIPFSLKEEDATINTVDGFDYWVYDDPGNPWYIQNDETVFGLDDPYKWGFAMVSVWSAHLDPADETMIDISPASIGNIQSFPTNFEEYKNFYDFENGGDASIGREINPSTGNPYTPQMVPRGDYGRVLAEFWADGPDSETPPGHWFTLLNYVNDHPDLEKKFNGQGEVLSDLEWDVKSYLLMAGTVHDVAITSWGIKGYYDYIRPISAIRYMADKGQSSNPNLDNYHPHGIPLIPNYIEVIEEGDVLAGTNNEYVGKIKLYAWKGPEFIIDPENDVAGVDWILAENWMPYQRPSFVTPPFAGFVSGHSTFSRAAAEVMTLLTGDEFFPGGMGTFDANQNEFLVFEDGPSENIVLQWATYRDASDQCSLSRIWGGIHPPVDDIPGRILGEKIGVEAFHFAKNYFYADSDGDGYYSFEDCDDNNPLINPSGIEVNDNNIDEDCNGSDLISDIMIYPNPIQDYLTIYNTIESSIKINIYNMAGVLVLQKSIEIENYSSTISISELQQGVFILEILTENDKNLLHQKIIKL